MDDVKTRRLPYLFTFLLYTAFSILFSYKFRNLKEISICLFSISFCLLLVFIISLFWKISAHMVGISGVLGAIFTFIIKNELSQLFIPFILLLILTGIIAAARLKLNAHNPYQIIGGFLLGFFISISITFIFI